jgi:hypothetical protein
MAEKPTKSSLTIIGKPAPNVPEPPRTFGEAGLSLWNRVQAEFDYLERAKEFMGAFRALPSGNPPSWPRYFLLCHAIELALKGFLVSRYSRLQEQPAEAVSGPPDVTTAG